MTNQDASRIIIDGKEFGTGLMTPPKRPLTFRPLSSAIRPLSKQTIAQWIADPRRTPSSKLFPPDRFIADQGPRGSCNGHAAAKALEKNRVLLGMKHVSLSGSCLYSHVSGGRDNGSMLDDGMEALMKIGTCSWDRFPVEEYRQDRMSGEAWAECELYQARECYRLDTEIDMASALVSNFMVVVAVHAGRNFMRLDATGLAGSDSGNGNHACNVSDVAIVNGELRFRLDNSWGLSYGDNGSCWTTFRRHYARTIKVHAFYAVRSAIRRG